MSPFRSRGGRKPKEAGPEGVALPKWAGLLVAGKPVSDEEAAAIIIRTGGFDFFSNESDFMRELYREIGVRVEGNGGLMRPVDRDLAKAKAKYRVLDLLRLRNHRIVSCWIGGPHGWCDWNGSIGACTYNVGKYPDAVGILDEWAVVAASFPFLSLTCQLLSGEIGERGARPVVEYRVENGSAVMKRPGKRIVSQAKCLAGNDAVIERFAERMAEGGEIGCSVAAFRDALAKTSRYNAKKRGNL